MPLSQKIQAYVDQKELTLEQALSLDWEARYNLESEAICDLIANGTLPMEQAIGLNIDGRENLESAAIRDLIAHGLLPIEQAIGLNKNGRENLESAAIRDLITKQMLTLEQAIGLHWIGRYNLESEGICGLIANDRLSMEQAIGLEWNGRNNLASAAIRDLIVHGMLPIEQAIHLDNNGRRSLESEGIRGFIADGMLTLEQAIDLNSNGRENLESAAIRGFIAHGLLTLEQALGLNGNDRWNLEPEAIRGFIAAGSLTLAQAIGLDWNSRNNLASAAVCGLIEDGTLTLAQAIALSYEGRRALYDADTRQRLRDGRLTVQDFMDEPLPLGIQATPINETQSTHTASVHQTASASAKKLHDRYAGNMPNETLHTMKTTMDALPSSAHNEAAKRCIERLAALETLFTDPSSGVTLHELLALSWLAIHDDAVRMGTVEDAITLYIEGLYEIQRGYNVSTGKDSGGEDRPICLAGTFNKLLEKLQGVHPDVEILVITQALAALKLPIVVREEAIKYLREPADQSTLSAVKEDSVEIIWKDIQFKVAKRMFDEFGSLYANEEDIRFNRLIEEGKYVAFSEEEFQAAFPDFQEKDNENGGTKPSVRILM